MNTWIIPPDQDVYFEFKDFKTVMQMNFEVTDNGYLKPVVFSSMIDFGESMLYHTDWFQEALFHQTIKFLLVIIQNSVWIAGQYIFSNMFEPILTRFLREYKMHLWLKSPFDGQYMWDLFEIDYRQTRQPVIG